MKSALRILIVEDDAAIACVLRDNLVFEGFEVDCVADGREVLAKVNAFLPHLILLDLTLPGDDGFEVCRVVTQLLDPPSIIMLTARGQHEDKVRGLRLGADDYVTKPFKLDELLARVQAVLRRAHPPADQLVLTEGTVVDFRRHRVMRDQAEVDLTDREFDLLRCFAERVGRTVTRAELLRVVWGYRDMPLTRLVDNTIVRLRRKIEKDPQQPRIIRTVQGEGYCFRPDAS
ncbi:MAG: response regulator transcription factor [Acidobacteria bacterium]|nr:response regulator transcription factor [Acidobacteriota bacterium]